MASQHSIARRGRIEAIRDKALNLIERHGKPEHIRNAPEYLALAAALGPFDMSFTRWAGSLKHQTFQNRNLIADPERVLLDIWGPHGGKPRGKVMSIRWEGAGPEKSEVVSFRRGEWEEVFLGLERS